ncbi:MAG: hypothetical protein ACYDHP_02305 [Ferrimicrobium sp.]
MKTLASKLKRFLAELIDTKILEGNTLTGQIQNTLRTVDSDDTSGRIIVLSKLLVRILANFSLWSLPQLVLYFFDQRHKAKMIDLQNIQTTLSKLTIWKDLGTRARQDLALGYIYLRKSKTQNKLFVMECQPELTRPLWVRRIYDACDDANVDIIPSVVGELSGRHWTSDENHRPSGDSNQDSPIDLHELTLNFSTLAELFRKDCEIITLATLASVPELIPLDEQVRQWFQKFTKRLKEVN